VRVAQLLLEPPVRALGLLLDVSPSSLGRRPKPRQETVLILAGLRREASSQTEAVLVAPGSVREHGPS